MAEIYEDLRTLKARYRIPHAWSELKLPGKPAKSCCSPFRDESNPSFSVYEDGLKWHDFADGQGGDVVDFVEKGLGVDTAEAIEWVKEKSGWKPLVKGDRPGNNSRGIEYHAGNLRAGTKQQKQRLAMLRGLSDQAIACAERIGFLKFGKLYNREAWAITDEQKRIIEFRRLDGLKWESYGGISERKAHCVGSGKSFPVGLETSSRRAREAGTFQMVLVEGAPDLLAAIHLIMVEGKVDSVFPVAMLGAASHRLDNDAKKFFSGMKVRIFPHADDAGMKACIAWAKEIKAAGGIVDAFDLSGIVTMDGNAGKDLNDLVNLDADCWERTPKFRGEVMP